MAKSHSRRQFLHDSTTATAGVLLTAGAVSAQHEEGHGPGLQIPPAVPAPTTQEHVHKHSDMGYRPVEVPDVSKLPYEMDGSIKVFHLVCEPVKRTFVPGWTFDLWGYNGSVPGPTIEAVEGDRVRIHVTNKLPELTSMHWHGLELPIGMDGVPGVCQDPILPGETYIYEFDLIQNGTFFYHSHMPMQELIGMIGFFIIHPQSPYDPPADRDFGLVLQEWAVLPNNTVPNTLSMEFNWLTFNGKAGPDITPLLVQIGERVRIRFINMGMDHHPIHIHGNTWQVTGTEGGRIPPTAWIPGNTVLVGVAQARDVEFVAKYPGDWMLHCHLPHHMMNHMMSMVGPMAHGPGVPGGMSMTNGMGMLQQGNALSEDFGPSLGRAMGLGSEQERVVSNHLGIAHENHQNRPDHSEQMQDMPEHHGMNHDAHQVPAADETGNETTSYSDHMPTAVANAGAVPGYPQDMFMPNDRLYDKPENYGLRPGWSGAVEGMTTLVRVLTPEMFEKIRALQKESNSRVPREQKPSSHQH